MKRNHPNPAGGRWAWRQYLPATIDEWLEMRERAAELTPDRIDPARWSDWLLAEMRGEQPAPSSSATGARYRRLLYELATLPPQKPARRKVGAAVAKGATELYSIDGAGNPRDRGLRQAGPELELAA